MPSVSLARRASSLAPALPPSPPAGAIAFDSGHACAGVLPDLVREGHVALSRYRTETLQYAPRAGLPELRAWIADYMAADGARVSVEEILVTNGAKHGLELICRLLLDEGDSVVVTAPTYFSAIPILRSFGVTFLEVGQDDAGLDVGALAALVERIRRDRQPLPKFIYNVPDFHNPTGVTMSLERRRALIELAVEHGIVLVEDSPYREVRFEESSLPSLKALDAEGIVFQLGTFSKLMAPGLRVGWVAALPEHGCRMAQLKTDAGSCPLTQRMILEFGAAGRLGAHIERVRAAYAGNRDRMVTALRRELPEVSMEIPRGGYYLWLTLPDGIDSDDLATRATAAGVVVLAGSKFFARRDVGHATNHIRLAFSHATHDDIDEGVRRLAQAYGSMTTGADRHTRSSQLTAR